MLTRCQNDACYLLIVGLHVDMIVIRKSYFHMESLTQNGKGKSGRSNNSENYHNKATEAIGLGLLQRSVAL